MWLTKNVPDSSQQSGGGGSGQHQAPQSAKTAMLQLLGTELAAVAKAQWTGPIVQSARVLRTAPIRIPFRGRALKIYPGLEPFYRDYLAPIAAQPPAVEDLPAAVFESMTLAISEARGRENERQATLDSGLNPLQYRDKKKASIANSVAAAFRASLAASEGAAQASSAQRESLAALLESYGQSGGRNGGRFARQVKYQQEEAAPVPQETAEERFNKLEKELEEKLAELSRLQSEAAAIAEGMQAFDARERQVEADGHAEDAQLVALEREYRVKKRTFDLLPEADANIAELQRIADGSAQRLVDLATEWEKHRAPLIDELRRLQDMQDEAMSESRIKLEEIKKMRAEIKQLIEEIRAKEDRCKQLLEAYRSMTTDQSRSAHTRRIIDIVRNVKKQKLDIAKILEDTRQLQKEINSVRDTLGRSYGVADETIFQDAKRESAKGAKADPTRKEAYRLLISLNESFEKLVAAIEETGQTRAAILNLESKIDMVQARNTSVNMGRIVEDLRQVRDANAALQARLAAHEKH